MKLTANFSKAEFDSKDGAVMPLEVLQNVQRLAENLQIIRDELGVSIRVNSGWRSQKHNREVGGAKTSQHLTGNAADIVAVGVSPRNLAKVIRQLMDEGKIEKGGLKAYNTFVHYDRRGDFVTW